jgi:DNA-binding NarL/FixJ family response regulator
VRPIDLATRHRRFIVLEGGAGSAREATRLRAEGYDVRAGFGAAGLPSGRTVCQGTVASDADASAAVLAALAGHGLLIEATAGVDTIATLLDDLRHIGPVEHRRVDAAPPPPALDPEGRAILRLLARGQTLGSAAQDLGLTRRTADRRLAAVRRELGVERTAEAIARATRLGWID